MVDARLKNYVKEQLKKGYSETAVRQTLRRSGYTKDTIDSAFQKKSHIVLIIVAIIFLVGVVTTLFFLLQPESTPTQQTTLNAHIKPETSIISAGEALEFTLTIGGSSNVNNGKVQYSIIDDKDNTIVSKQEDISFQKQTQRDSLILPNTLSKGDYFLAAKISSGNDVTETTAKFEIIIRSGPIRVQAEKRTTPSLSDEKRIEEIVTLASHNPNQARTFCLEFSDDVAADQCLLDAGLTINDDGFCPEIKNLDKRDTCYFNLVLITDEASLCNQISNENLRGTCSKI